MASSSSSSMPPPPSRPPKPAHTVSADAPSHPMVVPDGQEDAAAATNQPQQKEEGKTPEDAIDIPREAALRRDWDTHSERRPPTSSECPYTVPPWSAAPMHPFFLEVIKDGLIIDKLNVSSKGAYMFGRSDRCDFMLEHPSISRYHAVLQFKRTGDAFIYDLGSTHKTVVNKTQVTGRIYTPVHVGDVIKFGLSSRLYVLLGPTELMPKEAPSKAEKELLQQLEVASGGADAEASLLRARREAIQMEGVSWGMIEDAFEDEIKEEDEVTWQTYKGQLTEKQEKTLEKIKKRNEKISSLRREIDAIQVKEIPQGGLTQGQQTQVARNEQRIEQLMEELENLEETLNQSIQESIGARVKKLRRENEEDEYDNMSDDDEFYDRTNQKSKKNVKLEQSGQVVETVESLLEKRDKLVSEIDRLTTLLECEVKKDVSCENMSEETKSELQDQDVSCENMSEETKSELQDPLDAFMTSVSSTLESDRVYNIKKDLEIQQTELDRILFLLKIADPPGEALKRWHSESDTRSKIQAANASNNIRENGGEIKKEKQGETNDSKPFFEQDMLSKAKVSESMERVDLVSKQVTNQDRKQEQAVVKGPIWLGHPRETKSDTAEPEPVETQPSGNEFLEYHDRRKLDKKLIDPDYSQEIPEDARGLILRKPKNPSGQDTQKRGDKAAVEKTIWDEAAAAAADTVARLLRHQKGLGAVEETEDDLRSEEPLKESKKRKLGPEKPSFLNTEESKFQAWVPPKGQTGDGRTALNEKYGY